MSRGIQLLSRVSALLLACMAGSGQNTVSSRGSADTIVEISDGRSVDVARIAPDQYFVEMDNPAVRVLRVRLAAGARVPTHGHNGGVIIALTAVHLRLSSPDGGTVDIRLAPGEIRWSDAGIHSELNLAGAPCEFLFIDEKSAGGPIPHSPPA